ncbi:MAG: PAS domain-containing protein [bacterium]|nr:PAS domain-containing protein [bacterium]
MSKSDKDLLNKYADLAEFIAKSLEPFVETVVHDLRKQNYPIYAIFNTFTARKKGDPTNIIGKNDKNLEDYPDNLYGIKWITETNNKPVRSGTKIIRNNRGRMVAAMSINVNLEHFENLRMILEQFSNFKPLITLSREEQQYQLASKDEIKKVILSIIHQHNLDPQNLSRKDKLEVVRQLFRAGHFLKRGMVTAVSEELKLTRATIYSYIRAVKEEAN